MKLCSVWLGLLLSCSHMNNSSTPSTKWIFTLNYSESDLHKSPYKKRISFNENHLQFRKKFPVSAVKDDERGMKSSSKFSSNHREFDFHDTRIWKIILSRKTFARERKKKSFKKHLKASTRDINHRFFFCFVIIC